MRVGAVKTNPCEEDTACVKAYAAKLDRIAAGGGDILDHLLDNIGIAETCPACGGEV